MYVPGTPTVISFTENPSVVVVAAPAPDPESEIVIAGEF